MDIVVGVFLGLILGWMGREALVVLDYCDEDRRRLCWQPMGKDLE